MYGVHNTIEVCGEYRIITMHLSHHAAFTPETRRVGGPPDQEKGSADSSIASYLEVPGWILGPETEHTEFLVVLFSFFFFKKNPGYYFKLGHILFLPHFFPLIIQQSAYHSTLNIIWIIGRVFTPINPQITTAAAAVVIVVISSNICISSSNYNNNNGICE